MGIKGRVPERKENLLGKHAQSETDAVTRIRIPTRVSVPQHDPNWHPIAIRLYKSVKLSGQTKYYEPSDWAVLYFACDEIDFYMRGSNRTAMRLTAINQMLTTLLLTEGDRRRVQMEIDRGPEEESVADQADAFYADMLSDS